MKKILIIEDDVDILEALRMTFELASYQVKITTNGDEGLELANKFKPNVILLDVFLSGYDGRVICQELKSSVSTKKIPVVIVSAYPGVANFAKNIGADAFVSKPFDIDVLIKEIEKVIN